MAKNVKHKNMADEGSKKGAKLIFQVNMIEIVIYQYITISQKLEMWPGKLFPAFFLNTCKKKY